MSILKTKYSHFVFLVFFVCDLKDLKENVRRILYGLPWAFSANDDAPKDDLELKIFFGKKNSGGAGD